MRAFRCCAVPPRAAAAEHDWLPKILARDYDPRERLASRKRAALLGMGMTERQGGSDVRSNRTRAAPDADGPVRITGHKWFFSAPQCDAHLVLAQAPGGFRASSLPRFLPDGTRNAIQHPAAQGQARQPLERVGRGRARRRDRVARRRGGTRHRDDHRDGAAHTARLCARHRRASCARRWRARSITRATASRSATRSPRSR